MNNGDMLFLSKFKDLKIVIDSKNSSKDKTAYDCFIDNQPISYRKVVELVKQYQDELMDRFLNDNLGE